MFKEINFEKLSSLVDLDKMTADGVVYVVRNYSPLISFLQEFLEFNFKDDGLDKFLDLDRKLSEFKNDGKFSDIFLNFLVSQKINYPLSQIDIGNPRIVFPHNILTERIKNLRSKSELSNSSFRNYLSPPHRDLNRPHYNRQFNIWWTFHDITKNESLVFFPESYKKQVFPFVKKKTLDANSDAEEFSKLTDKYHYDEYRLGKSYQTYLNKGDFLFFNSEHYHCSPKKVKNVRVSCEMRFVDKSFDNNDHYKKDSFYFLKNFSHVNGKMAITHIKNFPSISKIEQRKIFDELDEDLKISLITNNSLKFKLSLLENVRLIWSIKSFYFLEKLQQTNNKLILSLLISYRLEKLSKDFVKNHFNFNNNPVNYFKKGHHGFNQPYPNLMKEKIKKKLDHLSISSNTS